jgi:methionine biosynthesis protein MetW
VVQGDADRDLADYPAKAFDYAILSQTLQTVRDPRAVLNELMRIADRAIVSFPNIGHWSVRWSLLTKGRMPTTRSLPTPWWATPNIHLCTLRDFTDLAADLDLRIEDASALIRGRPARAMTANQTWENWRAEQAIFLLARREAPEPAQAFAQPKDQLF